MPPLEDLKRASALHCRTTGNAMKEVLGHFLTASVLGRGAVCIQRACCVFKRSHRVY